MIRGPNSGHLTWSIANLCYGYINITLFFKYHNNFNNKNKSSEKKKVFTALISVMFLNTGS
jgi:hypothetical protein